MQEIATLSLSPSNTNTIIVQIVYATCCQIIVMKLSSIDHCLINNVLSLMIPKEKGGKGEFLVDD